MKADVYSRLGPGAKRDEYTPSFASELVDAGNFLRWNASLMAPRKVFLCMDLSQRILAQRRSRQCNFLRARKDL
jgi:hypothetical protein